MQVRRPCPVSGIRCRRAEQPGGWSLIRHVKFVRRTLANRCHSWRDGTRGSRLHEEPRPHIAKLKVELAREIGRTGGDWSIEGP
jgi:hypothetical protein